MSESVSLVQKKIIQSLLYGNYDIINVYYARVYTCGKDSKFWLYSGLEGALVYCIEVRAKTCKFLLFDLKSFEITFDCELYKKFNNSYKKGTDTFYYFGVNDGFIGFEIPDATEATELENEMIGFSDEMIKGRLRDYKPMKDNELKEKGRQMIQHLKTRLHSSGGKSSKSEIVINQGELENKINTVEVDDSNRRLILTGTSYKGIDRDLKKVKGLYLEQNSNAQESDVYSKYMARNILGSLMKGLVVPKRKIDRKIWEDGEEPTAPSQDDIKEKKEKEKERKREEKEKEKERKREEKERKEREKKEKKKKSVANVSPPKTSPPPDVKFLDSGKPSGPPPPPPPPMVHNEINPEFEKKAKEEAARQPKKSSKPVDLAAELAAKKNALAHVEVKEYVSPALQKQGEGGDDGGAAAYGGNSMMAAIMAKRNAMKKVGGGGPSAAPSNPAPARPPPRQSNPTVQPPKPSFQPPKPTFQPPKPAPKPAPKKSEPAYVPPAKEPSPPKVTFLDKGKGSGKAPPPPPPPPMVHNEFNPEFAKKAKEEAAKQPKKTSSRPVDLAAELAAKKKNLAKVEVKEYVSPALQKQGEGGGDDGGAAAYGGNSMMAAIMAKRNAMKKIGGGGPATGTAGGAKPAFQPPAAKPAFQPPAAKPSFQPAAAKPSFQPAAAKPAFQPAAAKPHFQPATAKPSFQPAAAKPHFQPPAATSSSGAAKPGFNPPGARPPMKIGAGSSSGGFASMIAALSNKMGGGAGGNKSSAPSQPANTKPIVELAAGTKKQLNMNKLIGSLNQSMAKKNQVTEKQPEVKFLDSGKPKGPPPPPPPPLPK